MTSPVPPAPEEGEPVAWAVVDRDGYAASITRSFSDAGLYLGGLYGGIYGPYRIVPLYSADDALLARLAAAEKARDEAVGLLKEARGWIDPWRLGFPADLLSRIDAALKRDGEG